MASTNTQSIEITQLPFAKSFAAHETFAFRHAWLKKGVDNLTADPELFLREDAIVTLGVGKNMVRSIRHWCLATRMIEEEPGTRGKHLHPSELGNRLLNDTGWDPYLEDEGTLWLLHWNLSCIGTRATTWYWAFNRFYEYAFTRAGMVEALTRFVQTVGWNEIAGSSIKRDVDCFVHSYLPRGSSISKIQDPIECPLTGLNLLVQEPDGDRIRFCIGAKPTLPIGIFAYALAEYWNCNYPDRKTLEMRQITGNEGSPSFIFKLDEESILDYLDQLKNVTGRAMMFEDTVQVRRVVKLSEGLLDSMSFLENHYAAY